MSYERFDKIFENLLKERFDKMFENLLKERFNKFISVINHKDIYLYDDNDIASNIVPICNRYCNCRGWTNPIMYQVYDPVIIRKYHKYPSTKNKYTRKYVIFKPTNYPIKKR